MLEADPGKGPLGAQAPHLTLVKYFIVTGYFDNTCDSGSMLYPIELWDCFGDAIASFGLLLQSYVVTIIIFNNNIYYLYCAFSIKYSKAHHNSN